MRHINFNNFVNYTERKTQFYSIKDGNQRFYAKIFDGKGFFQNDFLTR